MTLEEILRNLQKCEYLKYESTDQNYNVIEVWRNFEGSYRVGIAGRFSDSYKTPEELLKYIKDSYSVKWTEFDYEVYKEHRELKEENAQLKKALRNACGYICCEYCALYDEEYQSCSKGLSDRFCDKELFDYFLEGGI